MYSSEIDHITAFNTLVGILSLLFGSYPVIVAFLEKKDIFFPEAVHDN